jgi:hypothetical protein
MTPRGEISRRLVTELNSVANRNGSSAPAKIPRFARNASSNLFQEGLERQKPNNPLNLSAKACDTFVDFAPHSFSNAPHFRRFSIFQLPHPCGTALMPIEHEILFLFMKSAY